MNEVSVKVKLAAEGFLPQFAKEGDVACDARAYIDSDVVIPSGERNQIPLGFALEIPRGYEVQVRPRSGLSKRGIDVTLGTGDEGFRGMYQATVVNNTKEDFIVHRGDRVCQIAIREVPEVTFVVVDELSQTQRGETGFGSSGVK